MIKNEDLLGRVGAGISLRVLFLQKALSNAAADLL